jgi:ABC-type glycerol-3-phosphate transport system substrate-binding protein
MNLTKNQLIIIGAGIVALVGIYFLFTLGSKKQNAGPPITLTVWGTENKNTINDLIALYGSYRPGAQVTYTEIDPSVYESKLLSALAAGTGPDVFEIGNREVPRWEQVIAPLPSSTFASQIDLNKLQTEFPSVVSQDFVQNGDIYGLPFSIDTLAMVYNRTYLDSAGIALPPTTWNDFENDIPKLREISAQGQITRAAAAIGGTRASIANADDILYALMLQNGTKMVSSDHTAATFAEGGTTGLDATNFYLQFSDASSPYYTWNDSMGDAIQSFTNGQTAIIFAYQSDLASIRAKAPFLSIGVASMPQAAGATLAVNYPKYLGFVAAKKGNSVDAWDFIVSLADYTTGENVYIKDANAPAAQRVALADQVSGADPVIAVFAKQALSAQSWYEADDQKIDAAFDTALASIINGSAATNVALRDAESSVSAAMRGQQ